VGFPSAVPFCARQAGRAGFLVGAQTEHLGPSVLMVMSEFAALLRRVVLIEHFNMVKRSQRDCSPFYRGLKFDKRWERKSNEESNHCYPPLSEQRDTSTSTTPGT
jgi:hypothetical protein